MPRPTVFHERCEGNVRVCVEDGRCVMRRRDIQTTLHTRVYSSRALLPGQTFTVCLEDMTVVSMPVYKTLYMYAWTVYKTLYMYALTQI